MPGGRAQQARGRARWLQTVLRACRKPTIAFHCTSPTHGKVERTSDEHPLVDVSCYAAGMPCFVLNKLSSLAVATWMAGRAHFRCAGAVDSLKV